MSLTRFTWYFVTEFVWKLYDFGTDFFNNLSINDAFFNHMRRNRNLYIISKIILNLLSQIVKKNSPKLSNTKSQTSGISLDKFE